MRKLHFSLTATVLSIACLVGACKKRPDMDWLGKSKDKATESSDSEPGVKDPDGVDTPVPEVPDTAGIALYETILAGMKAKYPGEENQTWFASKSQIEGEWVADSPKTYWDIKLDDLPRNFDCVKGNIGCDLVFERKLCTQDSDCAESKTHCQELLASVAKPGEAPKKMCLGSGDKVIDDYYGTMVKTEKHLEISSLTLPSGRFYKAMINALALLSHKNASTNVRILISSVSGLVLQNFTTPPKKVLNGILDDINAAGGDSTKLRMNLGYLYKIKVTDTSPSWNHTKIVLADSNHILQGGHNFLDPDYVSTRPIFDLSMHASGSSGLGVQKFVDFMWSKASPYASNLDKDEIIAPPAVEDKGEGKVLTIGMGRMGDFGEDPADEGFLLLLRAAKKSIILAQQDLYNDITQRGAKPSHALPDLVDAILRGVHVKVAQSSSTKLLGYGTVHPDKASKMLREAIIKEANARKFVPPDNLSLTEYICQQLEYAPFLFSSEILEWPKDLSNAKEKDLDRQLGVHPKLIVIDETGFYLGSQNFYPSDLQEFGLFISDTKITGQILDRYWNKIWANSSKRKVACR